MTPDLKIYLWPELPGLGGNYWELLSEEVSSHASVTLELSKRKPKLRHRKSRKYACVGYIGGFLRPTDARQPYLRSFFRQATKHPEVPHILIITGNKTDAASQYDPKHGHSLPAPLPDNLQLFTCDFDLSPHQLVLFRSFLFSAQ